VALSAFGAVADAGGAAGQALEVRGAVTAASVASAGAIQVGAAADLACGASTAGALRWNAVEQQLEYCGASGGSPPVADHAWRSLAMGAPAGLGKAAGNPAGCCKDILDAEPLSPSGKYWIAPIADTTPYQVSCLGRLMFSHIARLYYSYHQQSNSFTCLCCFS
jgi:hypothetical protein